MISSLLVLVLAAFVLRRVVGRSCWPGAWSDPVRIGGRGAFGRDRHGPCSYRHPRMMPRPIPETPLESLQRRFARGDMSIEQYEHEVGRLYGLKG